MVVHPAPSSTRWSSSATAPCWRSWEPRTCGSRCCTRSPGKSIGRWPRQARLAPGGSPGVRSPGPGAFPLPARWPARPAGAGGRRPVILNAANEIAVAALLAGRLRYVDIPGVIAEPWRRCRRGPVEELAGGAGRRCPGPTEAAVRWTPEPLPAVEVVRLEQQPADRCLRRHRVPVDARTRRDRPRAGPFPRSARLSASTSRRSRSASAPSSLRGGGARPSTPCRPFPSAAT